VRAHLSNAAYGVLDYAAYPVAMLAAAPALLHHLGVAQYGVWVVCTAAVSTGAIIAAGFGDANIQYVASMNSLGNKEATLHAVRSMLGINLLLGCVFALISLAFVPMISHHVAALSGSLYQACLWSLRIASVLMLVRAIESVCVSTQRAFERYGEAVRISILVRVVTIAAAVVITRYGYGVISIMVFTFVLMTLGTLAQLVQLKRRLGASSLWPAFDKQATSALFEFGIFSWLMAVSTVLFNQADRLILGVSLGAATVTSYALCVQLAQPIYGIAAAGLHFLFPYLAARQAISQPGALRKNVLIAFAANLAFIVVSTSAVLFFGRPLLNAWVGPAIAQSASVVLSPIVWSFALLGLGVTGYYSLLALGHVRSVTWLNLLGGAAMLALMAWLLPRTGVRGVAIARLVYGLITLLMYFPLVRILFRASKTSLPATGLHPVCEDL
jgi:O-antigen/teichoic acid export membrane protein